VKAWQKFLDWFDACLDAMFYGAEGPPTPLELAAYENQRLKGIKRTRELEAENAKLREELEP
jgi:hypothetical protein